ncbi:hypothetical protein [Blastococcus sp. TML/M2B]|uniref:hypothetical protein n=1 Tax=Blastococcus sp. TML/M2B TaxID=2798727 RepID=UPI001F5BD71D|nr:hypothetical protein [Blastococcus sp. TML/M2B]
MLPLTPLPPQTDGERAFFSELVRWDTGNAVRGAVVAAIPFSDGPLQRRLSDAILFVPEGIAVIRVAEVARQSGVVNASPEGPWTIGPAGTGGAVLQLAGGGSTPLDGLMRAGMETAVRLRRAGLEPGRIARLTVLSGDVDGLLPADGDLGEGDQVALLETRSLLLGFARASRYTGVDNPRLWTTADVRAALEALGLQGRGPSVEELNGEGFPYSPYVLRRPQLLTPAAMAASPGSAAPTAPATTPATTPQPVAPSPAAGPSRAAIDQAVAASVAAAHAAAAATAPKDTVAIDGPAAPGGDTVAIDGPSSSRDTVARDTVAVDGPADPPGDAGIGGLFAAGEPDAPPAAPRTSVLPAQQPVAPQAAAPVAAQPAPQQFWDAPDQADAGTRRAAPAAPCSCSWPWSCSCWPGSASGWRSPGGTTAAPVAPPRRSSPRRSPARPVPPSAASRRWRAWPSPWRRPRSRRAAPGTPTARSRPSCRRRTARGSPVRCTRRRSAGGTSSSPSRGSACPTPPRRGTCAAEPTPAAAAT